MHTTSLNIFLAFLNHLFISLITWIGTGLRNCHNKEKLRQLPYGYWLKRHRDRYINLCKVYKSVHTLITERSWSLCRKGFAIRHKTLNVAGFFCLFAIYLLKIM
jgi:hypothetical protein